MKGGKYEVIMFLYDENSELKYSESTCSWEYAMKHYTEQLVEWAISQKLTNQPLWSWTQDKILFMDKTTPSKCRKGRINRTNVQVPMWNSLNVPMSMVDPKKQFVVNNADLATEMSTTDIIKAASGTTPQTWNRTKYEVKPYIKGHKNVV